MNYGYIQLLREIIDWEWYTDLNVKSTFLHILIKANYEQKSWRGYEILRGQLITSNDHLSNEIGLSIAKVRLSLKKLEKTNYIKLKTTNKNTIITIVNYDSWVGIENKITNKTTNKQQTTNKQTTTTKEDNNIKENKKDIERELSAIDFLKINFPNEFNKIVNEWEKKFEINAWGFMIEKFNDFYFGKKVSITKLKKWIVDEKNFEENKTKTSVNQTKNKNSYEERPPYMNNIIR